MKRVTLSLRHWISTDAIKSKAKHASKKNNQQAETVNNQKSPPPPSPLSASLRSPVKGASKGHTSYKDELSER